MHLKLAKQRKFCKQKQPTPYQTHDELNDNSNEHYLKSKNK